MVAPAGYRSALGPSHHPSGFCYRRDMVDGLAIGGVILAAGESSRMGTDKALLPWPPSSDPAAGKQTFLTAAIRAFTTMCDFVIVVTGKNTPNVAPLAYAAGASLVINRHPELGQFSSLRVGLQEVMNRGRDAALITLVDRPPVSSATLQALGETFQDVLHRGKWAVVPQYEGKHGHPFLIGRDLIGAFLSAPPTAVARDIEHLHQSKIEYLPVSDPFVTANIDTPDQYAALLEAVRAK